MAAELNTRLGCPGVCPEGIDLVGLPKLDLRFRASLSSGVLQDSIGNCMDEGRMVPIEQTGEEKIIHNGYADDMFPICVYALDGYGTPQECPKKTLIEKALRECQAFGGVIKEG